MGTGKSFHVQILQDDTLLQDIFQLRCLAWENSPEPQIINFAKYPEGYTDILDKSSIHFICSNHQQAIVAAARLTKIKDIFELPSFDMI